MKLATFETGGLQRIGVIVDGGVVDLSGAGGIPADMISLITDWPRLSSAVSGYARGRKADFALTDVHLLAPVPAPQKIMAIGLNYADHIAETGAAKPDKQVWFSKLPNAVNGPHDPIHKPLVSDAVDYEAEFVVVIGKRCRHVPRDKAQDVIFGYCAGNDVSVRDWQKSTPQWILGKSFDTHAPFGPWIVTKDEVDDPHTLGIRCFVNGEKRQDSNTKHLVFNVFDQIAHLSKAMTLYPGDIIFTGTPGGVGMARTPPLYMKAGDRVRVEIDKIGALDAPVIAEPG